MTRARRIRTRKLGAITCVVAFAWVLAAASRSEAQASTASKMAAETLFDRGVELMRDGKFAEGCAQLEQSLAIEHGIGAMLYLAECYERLGRISSAWALFRDAASAARAEGQKERAELGADRARRLEARLPTLRLRVAEGNDMPGFTLELNGVSLPRSVWNQSFPVDPGDNHIEASAFGYSTFERVERVEAEGARVVVDVPVLDRDLQANARAEAFTPSEVARIGSARAPVGRDDRAEPATWQRPTALVVGGLGVVALGIGGYFGLRAISKDSASDERCSGDGACADRSGVELSEQANDAARLSNGFLIGGVALAAVGVVLYLSAPSEAAPTLALGGDGRAVQVRIGGSL